MGHLEIIKVLTENVEHKHILNEIDRTGKTARSLASSLGESEKCPEMKEKYEEIRKYDIMIIFQQIILILFQIINVGVYFLKLFFYFVLFYLYYQNTNHEEGVIY